MLAAASMDLIPRRAHSRQLGATLMDSPHPALSQARLPDELLAYIVSYSSTPVSTASSGGRYDL
jgi:hypothetical protein